MYFPSTLEARIYQDLKDFTPHVKTHVSLELVKATEDIPAIKWVPDFVLPLHDLLIEAKGEWVNNRSSGAAKAKFIMQENLARRAGWKVLTVGQRAFKCGHIQVVNYRDKPWLD